jgi:hypothetical protein
VLADAQRHVTVISTYKAKYETEIELITASIGGKHMEAWTLEIHMDVFGNHWYYRGWTTSQGTRVQTDFLHYTNHMRLL